MSFWESHETSKYTVRTALFWTITQRVVVIPYRRFGTTYRSHLQGHAGPEKSVWNCHYSLRNSQKSAAVVSFRGRSLNPHNMQWSGAQVVTNTKSLRLTRSMKHTVKCYSSSLVILFIPSMTKKKIPPNFL